MIREIRVYLATPFVLLSGMILEVGLLIMARKDAATYRKVLARLLSEQAEEPNR